jgi:hypothetical protein
MSQRFLAQREALAAGERAALTGLLEDAHRCMDELPALPASRPGAPAAWRGVGPYIPPQLLVVVQQGAEAVAAAAHRMERLRAGSPGAGVELPAFLARCRPLPSLGQRADPDLDCTSGTEPLWWVPGEAEECGGGGWGGDGGGAGQPGPAGGWGSPRQQEQERQEQQLAVQERPQSIAQRVLIGRRPAEAGRQQRGGPKLQVQLPGGAQYSSAAGTGSRGGPIQIGRAR